MMGNYEGLSLTEIDNAIRHNQEVLALGVKMKKEASEKLTKLFEKRAEKIKMTSEALESLESQIQ